MTESVKRDEILDQRVPSGESSEVLRDAQPAAGPSAGAQAFNAQPAGSMRELVTEIARALVDEPEAVRVDVQKQPEGTVLRLRVARIDVGKVIGKQGRTARSLRTILSAASMKLRHRYSLDILEVDELDDAKVGDA